MTIPSNAIPITISSLPVGTPTNVDTFVMVQNGVTKKGFISQLLNAANVVSTTTQVIAGAGLTGGGPLSSDVTLSLPTLLASGTVGSASSVPVLNYDTFGRLTLVSSAAIPTPSLQQVVVVQGTNPVTAPAVFNALQVVNAPVVGTDVARLSDIPARPSLQQVSVVQARAPVTQAVIFNSLQITNAPLAPTDAVRYADLQANELISFRPSVSYLANTSISGTYVNNTGISTATLTGTVELVIDGSSPVVGNRVLLIAQGAITGAAAGVSNGPYTVNANSASGFTLTRASDVPTYGNYYFVTDGNVEDGTSWVNNTRGGIVVGTDPISYTQFFASPNAGNMPAKPSGIATAGTLTSYAREDHVHPLSLGMPPPASGGGSLTYDNTSGAFVFTPASTAYLTALTLDISGAQGLMVTNGAITPTSTDTTIRLSWAGAKIPAPVLGDISAGTTNGTVYLSATVPFSGMAPQSTATWVMGPSPLGSVTSIGLSVPSPLVLSGGPAITSSGTFGITWGTGQIPAANLGTGTAVGVNFLSGGSNGIASWMPAVTNFSVVATNAAPLGFQVSTPTSAPTLTVNWSVGQIPAANLGTGTASGTTFLSGGTGTAGSWVNAVTSIAATVPTGFVVTGSPITTSGTIAIAYDPMNNIPPTSIADGNLTAGFVPTVRADGTLVFMSVSDPNSIVYAIALG